MVNGLKRNKADCKPSASLRVHLGRDIPAPGRDGDLQVALPCLADVHCELQRLPDGSPGNWGHETIACIKRFANERCSSNGDPVVLNTDSVGSHLFRQKLSSETVLYIASNLHGQVRVRSPAPRQRAPRYPSCPPGCETSPASPLASAPGGQSGTASPLNLMSIMRGFGSSGVKWTRQRPPPRT